MIDAWKTQNRWRSLRSGNRPRHDADRITRESARYILRRKTKGPSIDARAFIRYRDPSRRRCLSLRMKLDDVEFQLTVQVSPPLSSFCGSPLPVFAIESAICLFIAAS